MVMIYRRNRWPLAVSPLDAGRRQEANTDAPATEGLYAARRRLLLPGATCICGKPAEDVKLGAAAWTPICMACLRGASR